VKHDCYTDQQGRRPCTCKCDARSPYGSPWDWIDDIAHYYLDRALLIACAAVIVAIAYRIFH